MAGTSSIQLAGFKRAGLAGGTVSIVTKQRMNQTSAETPQTDMTMRVRLREALLASFVLVTSTSLFQPLFVSCVSLEESFAPNRNGKFLGSQEMHKRDLQENFDCTVAESVSEIFDIIVGANQENIVERIECRGFTQNFNLVGSIPENLPPLPILDTL